MLRLIAISILLISGQTSASEHMIDVQHDSARGVTCWILNNTGISCLPDSSLLQQTTPSSKARRASSVNSGWGNDPLVATPLPQDERFQL